MSKSFFSTIFVASLMACSTLSAAVATTTLSGDFDVVTMPMVNVVGKRATTKVVVMPTVNVIAHHATAVQVASR